MENSNQGAILHSQPESFGTDTGGPVSASEPGNGLNGDNNGDPTNIPASPDPTNADDPSDSPHAEPEDDSGTGGAESVDTKDDTGINPASADEEFPK